MIKKIMGGDVLFKKAFERTKDRFFNFLIITVLGWGLGIAVLAGFGVSAGIVFAVWAFVKTPGAVGVTAAVMSVASLALLFYLSSWAQLAMTDSLIQTKKLTPFETYKKVKPFVKNYVYFIFLLSLFLLGLLPFTILSLLIVGLLWSLWSLFSIFIFLEQKKKGLENLWISREMVNQKFWPIVGLAFVVAVVVLLISYLFISVKSGFTSSLISQLIITPFVTSFYYEMYKTLKVPQKVKKPVVWVVLSVIGFALMALIVAASYQVVSKALPELMKQTPQKKEFYKELLYPYSPDETI